MDILQNDLWPEDPRGGTYVPLSRGSDGQLHFSWPNAIRGAVNATHELFTAPGNAAQGKYTPSEMAGVGTRMALTLAGLGAGLPGEANALKTFGGIHARTADLPALTRALTMEGRGHAADQIWNDTGWFRGPEGKWRFEIPDSGAMLGSEVSGSLHSTGRLAVGPDSQPLSQLMDHAELYKAYPQLQRSEVKGGLPWDSAVYFPEDRSMAFGPTAPKGLLSNALHESQHAVQDIEGFAEGGSPEQFLPANHYAREQQLGNDWSRLADLADGHGVDPDLVMKGMQQFSLGKPLNSSQILHLRQLGQADPNLLEAFRQHYNSLAQLSAEQKAARQTYDNLAGEVEARNVQERHASGFGPETPPWQTPGYTPQEKQVVVLNGERQQMLGTPVDHDPFQPSQISLAPVEHDPWLHTSEPVDHDPFANQEAAK